MDWFAARALPLTPFRPEFEGILDELRAHPREFGVKSSKDYHVVADLKQFGYDAMFYGWKKHKDRVRGQTHKFEFQEVGTLTAGKIHADLERIVSNDPNDLEVMRTDFCADVQGLTVDEVNSRMRVRFKRRGSRYTEYLEIWNGPGDTRYHGARPNCFRVYNKTAQLEAKYKKEIRSLKKAAEPDLVMKAARFEKEKGILEHDGYSSAELESENVKAIGEQSREKISAGKKRIIRPEIQVPTFSEVYGLDSQEVLTRVERQMGSCVPNALSTWGKLKKNAPDFDPFTNVDFLKTAPRLPSRTDYTFAQYESGLRLRALLEEMGRDYTQNYIKVHNPGNAARVMEIYMPFLEAADTGATISRERLREIYRDSVSRQLAA